MKKSVWTDTVSLPEFKTLDRDIKTDVLIIGGGMCGILCAHFLKQAGIPCIVAEANRIASGITKNTTAKITSQHSLIYSKITKEYGKEKAHMYLDINQKALTEYEKLCKNIDCDFEKKDAYTYSLDNRAKIEEEVRALKNLGFDASFEKETELPFHIEGAVKFKNQAQFHPLKFIAEISKDLNIYENTVVRELTPNAAITDKGKIYAEHIIVATHFPFINKHGSYFLKLYQHRSYVSAYESSVLLNGMYVDEDKKGMSFRNYDNLLLIGGSGHRTGKQSEAWNRLHKFADKYYPQSKLKYDWAAQDCMSLDSIPYIGQYSRNTPDMFVATGFNKWGMTSSMSAAMILCDSIQGKKNDCADVFSPHRSMIRPQLLVNGFEATVNLITPTAKRCPHLGCALKWNKAEHTWDCPCHGSRFEKDGKIIDNPATGDLNN
jgi:glycine/D-amino acid oxidase-like deaminating enzyme